MNKKILTLVLITLIVGSGLFLALNKERPMEENAERNAQSQETSTVTAGTTGSYREYSEAAVAETTGTRLLFFHAPWCPQCRELEASIQAGSIPQDVTIFKVDYDSNQALRQKYGVTIQTTVVRLNENGDLAEKYVAYDDPSLQNIVSNLL